MDERRNEEGHKMQHYECKGCYWQAAIKHSNTIYDHSNSQVKQISARPGPFAYINDEKELVDWKIHMAE